MVKRLFAFQLVPQSPSHSKQFLLRQGLVLLSLFAVFSLILGTLVSLAVLQPAILKLHSAGPLGVQMARPDIVDRNGALLATDIEAPSLFANPSGLMDPVRVVKRLKTALPELDEMDLLRQLTHEKRQFVFIKRGVHPSKAQEVFDMGLPGVDVTQEVRRVYPKGQMAGYVLGHVDIDNIGRAGIEKYIDQEMADGRYEADGQDVPAVMLSLDVGASHILNEELVRAMRLYKAKAAAGVVMNVHSGEVIAMASLPRVDPQKPAQRLKDDRFDRVTGGVFELGSIFKTITLGMVLDQGVASLESKVDVRGPLKIDGHVIHDFHPYKGELSLRDVFVRSSNIGTAKFARRVTPEEHKDFLRKLRLIDPLKTEIGGIAKPETSSNWGKVHSVTASYGHGIAVSPLQFMASFGALVNGGIYVPPTFLKRDERQAKKLGERVISVETSQAIRRLLRQNVVDLHGSGKQAEVAAFPVGGKTGTAEKVVNGTYKDGQVRTSFISVFPYDQPEYMVFVMLDEPHAVAASRGLIVAGANAAPTTRRIIARLGPHLKMKPFFPVPYRLTAQR